ncbi:hypothetical protein ACHAW6_007190 [Cyclotella cf. meneghiniana]
MAENQQLNCITTPNANDVLSGRGNLANRHPGNEHFRSLTSSHVIFSVHKAKPRKAMYSKLIYDEIRSLDPPGRFIKQDPNTKLWNDIGKKAALAKTRQALREGAPELLRDLQTIEQFRLHSTFESNLAQAANVASSANDIYTPAEPNNQINPILSKCAWKNSSAESIGDESVLSLDSISNGMTNDATQISATMHKEMSRSFAEVPSHATWVASSSNSGEGTNALLQVDHSRNQMQIRYQPSNQWEQQYNIPSTLQNSSTQAPESHLHVAMLNTVNGVNQQRKFTASVSRNPINQLFSSSFENVPCLNSAGTSHQQQSNIVHNVSENGIASINKSTINTGIDAPFVNSAASSHQQQCSIINNLSGYQNSSINQCTIGPGIDNDRFVNSVSASHQQHCSVTNNIPGNENTHCLLPLSDSLSSNISNIHTTRNITQFLNYQSAYHQLMSKWNAQQNTAPDRGGETDYTPFQISRAKSA